MPKTTAPQRVFGRAVFCWLLIGLGVLLFSASLEGILPETTYMTLPVAVFIAPPLALLAIAVVLLLQGRATWKAPLGVIGSAAILVAAIVPLDYLSVRLNFLIHKPIYDSIVRDALAGRQLGTLRSDGRREGVRRGVSYSFRPGRPLVVSFQWKTSSITLRMVEYHERPTVCPEQPKFDPAAPHPESICVEWPSLGDGYVFWQGIF